MVRTLLRCACALALGLVVTRARAGDATAHTTFTQRAAREVAAMEKYKTGVGAPIVGGIAADGLFKIPLQDSENCAYDATVSYCGNKNPTDGSPRADCPCTYGGPNGQGGNEPDSWQCTDDRQPMYMNTVNLAYDRAGSYVATAASIVSSDTFSLVCNWSHFAINTNVALPSAADTAQINKDRAALIVDMVEYIGATRKPAESWPMKLGEPTPAEAAEGPLKFPVACDEATWRLYYRRVANQLHFVQDLYSEHHKYGNLVCTNSALPIFANRIPILREFKRCRDWLSDPRNSSHCDEAVANPKGPLTPIVVTPIVGRGQGGIPRALVGPPAGGAFNVKAQAMYGACADGVDIACMGLERTMRHHCSDTWVPGPAEGEAIVVQKTMTCSGPASDHGAPDAQGNLPNPSYCEGERFRGGTPDDSGEDYTTPAVRASVPALEEAVARWAEVCKQPDDPCDEAQCARWCRRSNYPLEPNVYVVERYDGYCTNATSQPGCALHDCTCLLPSECGKLDGPCCKTGDACKNPANRCDPCTGTCVTSGSGGPSTCFMALPYPPYIEANKPTFAYSGAGGAFVEIYSAGGPGFELKAGSGKITGAAGEFSCDVWQLPTEDYWPGKAVTLAYPERKGIFTCNFWCPVNVPGVPGWVDLHSITSGTVSFQPSTDCTQMSFSISATGEWSWADYKDTCGFSKSFNAQLVPAK